MSHRHSSVVIALLVVTGCSSGELIEQDINPPNLAANFPARSDSFIVPKGTSVCGSDGDFPTTRHYLSNGSSVEDCVCADLTTTPPAGVYDGWLDGQTSQDPACKASAYGTFCPTPFYYAAPELSDLGFADGYATAAQCMSNLAAPGNTTPANGCAVNQTDGPTGQCCIVNPQINNIPGNSVDDDADFLLCPRGGTGIYGMDGNPLGQTTASEIRSDGNWRIDDTTNVSFWGRLQIEWQWCRHYSGGVTLEVPSPNGILWNLPAFGPTDGDRVSVVGDWAIDKLGATLPTCKGWDMNAPGYAEIHEARIFSVVRPDPNCTLSPTQPGCVTPNDYYVFTSGFFANGSEQASELHIHVPLPEPVDSAGNPQPPSLTTTLVCTPPITLVNGGCPTATGVVVSGPSPEVLANVPNGLVDIDATLNTTPGNGMPVGQADDFFCSNLSCPCHAQDGCSFDTAGRLLDKSGTPLDLCNPIAGTQVAFAQVSRCTWMDPPDIWQCDSCECDDPTASSPPFVAAVQGCASGLDPSNPADQARACAAVCGGFTCGGAPACDIGACHAPANGGGIAHIVAPGVCKSPPPQRVSTVSDYTIQLDGTSKLEVGQFDSKGNFEEFGHTTMHGHIFLNDNQDPFAHGLEFADFVLTADDFTVTKQEGICPACITVFSQSFSDVSGFVPRRGKAVVTSPFGVQPMALDIGTGMLGIGALATTNGTEGESDFLNQGDITGTLDLVGGAFTLDGTGQDGNGNAAQFHLSGSIVNRPPTAVAGADLTVECQTPTTTPIQLDGGASFDSEASSGDRITHYQWFERLDAGPPDETEAPPPPDLLPLSNAMAPTIQATFGAHQYELHVYDESLASSEATQSVHVVDTVPPTLQVTSTHLCLWPPNHEFALFSLGQELQPSVTDACDAHPLVWIDSVRSNQPALAPGSGHTTPDVIFGTQAACLRAEREGTGAERSYTITVMARDFACNTSMVEVTVVVPHDQSGAADCLKVAGLDAPDSSCGAGPPIPVCVAPGS